MPDFNTHVLPILLGILTTAIIFLGRFIFTNLLLPRYHEFKLTGHSIEGNWEANFDDKFDPKIKCNEQIKIIQSGSEIKGTVQYSEIDKNNSSILSIKTFTVEGNFENDILSMIYWCENKKKKGRGTFCLKSETDDLLNGKYSWYEPKTKNIESFDYKWKRVNS